MGRSGDGAMGRRHVWNLELGISGVLQQPYHFHVIGLGEHIDEAEPSERISVLGEEADVP